MLGTWAAHGIDLMLGAAWESGVVLAGLSAGSLCWFEHGLTAFHGEATPIRGLGLLPGSNAVHYDDETRRSAFRAAIADGMPAGYGTGNGAALHFVGTELAGVVASRPDARAYRLARAEGAVVETELPCDFLGAVPEEPALAA
jgi:dipeptidase E